MQLFRGKLMAGDQVILSPVEGVYEYWTDGVKAGWRGEIRVAPVDTGALHRADRLDIDSGPMFDVTITPIKVGSHQPESVGEFQSNGKPLR